MNHLDTKGFEVIDNYDQSKNPFETSFKYIFKNEENSLKIAQEGLSDLINTVPVTISIQYEKYFFNYNKR